MALRLNDEFAPPAGGDDSSSELALLKRQLLAGPPAEREAALRRLVELRAETVLVECLPSENLVAAQLAASGLWECWLNEQGPDARRVMDQGIACMKGGQLEDALAIFGRLAAEHPGWAEAHNKQATVLYLLGNARGSLRVNGTAMSAGDGARIREAGTLHFDGGADAEVLLFDLRPQELPR